ncbi:hypothetical protein GYMLUDRAFT_862370 [Collybiopsis luxurians FD-317 M1]|nr:hypothetical protein GYMLUDRAFT_862370 [Collybiopsis luxurians FD-317 M1]
MNVRCETLWRLLCNSLETDHMGPSSLFVFSACTDFCVESGQFEGLHGYCSGNDCDQRCGGEERHTSSFHFSTVYFIDIYFGNENNPQPADSIQRNRRGSSLVRKKPGNRIHYNPRFHPVGCCNIPGSKC